jgi:glycosyltransferase involved in cell wall biosynthesis
MRVLAVSSYGVLGGAELSLAAFVEHRPPGVHVDALMVTDGPLGRRLSELGIATWAAAGYEGRPTPARLGRFSRSTVRLLDRVRPDVVWATGQKAALLSAPACRSRGIPLVWHKVDFSWDRQLAGPLAAASSGVVCVSGAIAAALGPLRRARLLGVVGPPLRTERALVSRPNPDRPVIGTLARLVPYKGHHHILRAAAALVEEFPSLRVVLAGGPAPEYPTYPAELRALAEETGIADRVELTGFVADVPRVLEGLTVFLNATYRDAEGFGLEGLSGAMLEASAAGIPVVATRSGGTLEGVVDGETATLIDAAEPGAIAAATREYLRDPELAARVGAAGRAFAWRTFAPERASQRLFGLLERAAGQRAARARS